jgi:hypothetical protein
MDQTLFDWVASNYDNKSQAVVDGLTLLKQENENPKQQSDERVEQMRDAMLTDLRVHNDFLQKQVTTLSDQLATKDEQIRLLNENMQSQTVNIHGLIQENNKLNQKLLPETTIVADTTPKPKKNVFGRIWDAITE